MSHFLEMGHHRVLTSSGLVHARDEIFEQNKAAYALLSAAPRTPSAFCASAAPAARSGVDIASVLPPSRGSLASVQRSSGSNATTRDPGEPIGEGFASSAVGTASTELRLFAAAALAMNKAAAGVGASPSPRSECGLVRGSLCSKSVSNLELNRARN